MGDAIQTKALNSRDRLEQLRDSFHFDHIFAKINPIEPQQPPPPQESKVVVITRSSLPPIPSSTVHGNEAFRNYPYQLEPHLSSRQTTQHPQSIINMCDLIKEGLIYSGNDPITGQNAYWYKLKTDDILSSYVAQYHAEIHGSPENKINDDVARGYIILLNNDDMERYKFNRVETIESCSSKGGKTSSVLQRKKRKNITKKRRRISRRKPRISRRKH